MNARLTYCKSWFRGKKAPTELWPEIDARRAHEEKRPYGVVVGSLEKPFCFIEINKGFVGVGFLDYLSRESLYYAFREAKTGLIFLNMAIYRDYIENTDKVRTGTTYVFHEDGVVKIERQNFNPFKSETSSMVADLKRNYAIWPEFGQYDDLIKIERNYNPQFS